MGKRYTGRAPQPKHLPTCSEKPVHLHRHDCNFCLVSRLCLAPHELGVGHAHGMSLWYTTSRPVDDKNKTTKGVSTGQHRAKTHHTCDASRGQHMHAWFPTTHCMCAICSSLLPKHVADAPPLLATRLGQPLLQHGTAGTPHPDAEPPHAPSPTCAPQHAGATTPASLTRTACQDPPTTRAAPLESVAPPQFHAPRRCASRQRHERPRQPLLAQ